MGVRGRAGNGHPLEDATSAVANRWGAADDTDVLGRVRCGRVRCGPVGAPVSESEHFGSKKPPVAGRSPHRAELPVSDPTRDGPGVHVEQPRDLDGGEHGVVRLNWMPFHEPPGFVIPSEPVLSRVDRISDLPAVPARPRGHSYGNAKSRPVTRREDTESAREPRLPDPAGASHVHSPNDDLLVEDEAGVHRRPLPSSGAMIRRHATHCSPEHQCADGQQGDARQACQSDHLLSKAPHVRDRQHHRSENRGHQAEARAQRPVNCIPLHSPRLPNPEGTIPSRRRGGSTAAPAPVTSPGTSGIMLLSRPGDSNP